MPDLTPAAPENRAPEEIRPAAETENCSSERRIQGRFAPGTSGNPGGRPKSLRSVVEAAREATEAAIAVLTNALSDPDPRVRIVAAKELLDRAWGRPGPAGPESQAPESYESMLGRLDEPRVDVRKLSDETLRRMIAELRESGVGD